MVAERNSDEEDSNLYSSISEKESESEEDSDINLRLIEDGTLGKFGNYCMSNIVKTENDQDIVIDEKNAVLSNQDFRNETLVCHVEQNETHETSLKW